MHGRLSAADAPQEHGGVGPDDGAGSTQCAQCGRDTDSSPSGDFCSEGCMRRWLRASSRRPDEVLGVGPAAAADRMVRRHTYLVATTGSWPDAWRIHSA
ncbi:MAG: hypothetical protein ABR608_09280 [Pseudonocardiaceae bacterium]